MARPLLSLVGFAAWAIGLVFAIAVVRMVQVLRGAKRANEFPSGTLHGGDAYWRLNRAHVNTVENLPIFGALVITGTLLHVATPAFQTLPVVVLAARITQSLVHLSSGSARAVSVRFTAFLTQLAAFAWMAIDVGRAAVFAS
jgi:uncharacterized MAPEG superfamily protein